MIKPKKGCKLCGGSGIHVQMIRRNLPRVNFWTIAEAFNDPVGFEEAKRLKVERVETVCECIIEKG